MTIVDWLFEWLQFLKKNSVWKIITEYLGIISSGTGCHEHSAVPGQLELLVYWNNLPIYWSCFIWHFLFPKLKGIIKETHFEGNHIPFESNAFFYSYIPGFYTLPGRFILHVPQLCRCIFLDVLHAFEMGSFEDPLEFSDKKKSHKERSMNREVVLVHR